MDVISDSLGVCTPAERAIQTPRAVWINAVRHSNHTEKMKMDDPPMKNIPRSKVTHHLTCSLWLSQPIIHTARLNTNTIPYKSMLESVYLCRVLTNNPTLHRSNMHIFKRFLFAPKARGKLYLLRGSKLNYIKCFKSNCM